MGTAQQHCALGALVGAGAIALMLTAAPVRADAQAGSDGPAHAQAHSQARADRAPQFLYARTCGYCHGHNVGPIIRGRELAPETIAMIVRNGNGAMPAFRPTEITDRELAALADWISKSAADPKEKGQ
jgi:mono/diheme cytochrome c family protein